MNIKPTQVQAIKQQFTALNRKRLEMTQQLLRPRQQEFLGLMPLLFHLNHASLPGFSGRNTPAGLANYHVNDATVKLAKKNWPSFVHERGNLQQCAIESLFLMGSSGSLAFSRKSDFDVWLCHTPELSKEQLDLLQIKATAIEQWADGIGLEVHFFLMDADQFRLGRIQELSSESSGSAQHLLLLDEFYRTSLWISGKYPLWWFIPPDQEADYEKLKKDILENRLLTEADVIDFGKLHRIPPEEYFGAAVWQIYKGIDSPYKSALKITLMEAYAHNNAEPLSLQFKRRVYQGVDDFTSVDPYLMLLEFLENHLDEKDEELRLETIRRSFYIKLDHPLSKAQKQQSWRHSIIKQLTSRWGWNDIQISSLDSRQKWSVMEIMDERKLLIDHLTRSYQFLSEYARTHVDSSMINEKDLAILGRKLYVVFNRSPGKIEIINRGISQDISEDTLSIIHAHDRNKRDRWLLFRDKVPLSQVNQRTPLKTTSGLVELVAWCFMNQVCTNNTQKLLIAPETGINSNGFDKINTSLEQLCSDLENFQPSTENLLRPTEFLSGILFLNASNTPTVTLSGKEQQIATGKIDVLQLIERDHSLFVTTELFYLTSWREAYTEKHAGIDGFFSAICSYLSWGIDNTSNKPLVLPKIDIHCSTPHIGKTLTSRVQQLLKEIKSHLFSGSHGPDTRLIIEAGKKFYLIQREDSRFTAKSFANSNLLMKALETNNSRFRPIALESKSLKNSALAKILSTNKPNTIQIITSASGNITTVYVLDEYGAIFSQQLKTCDTNKVMHYYYQIMTKRAQPSNSFQLEFFQLIKNTLDYQLRPTSTTEFTSTSTQPLHAQGKMQNSKPVFLFDCQDISFSSAELGSKVFQQVAEHINAQNRKKNQSAAVLVSSVQLDPALFKLKSSQQITTMQLLKYKRLFEEKLMTAIAS